ncbi:hypothetical protein WA026_001221 [Henosepilachna vigintioctopunctata]|uniref:GPR158/179 extracellular domain-containing protein n=1 Tax=Henosepilachna vigintioctopunctata TaxID=420089 RepID=A0AAW1UR57_9CUCU
MYMVLLYEAHMDRDELLQNRTNTGTSGIDIDLRRVDIDQCPLPKGSTQISIFAASDKCKNKTTEIQTYFLTIEPIFLKRDIDIIKTSYFTDRNFMYYYISQLPENGVFGYIPLGLMVECFPKTLRHNIRKETSLIDVEGEKTNGPPSILLRDRKTPCHVLTENGLENLEFIVTCGLLKKPGPYLYIYT